MEYLFFEPDKQKGSGGERVQSYFRGANSTQIGLVSGLRSGTGGEC